MDNKVKPLQSYMLIQLLKPFDLECKKMQTQLLNRRFENEYIDETYRYNPIEMYLTKKNQNGF